MMYSISKNLFQADTGQTSSSVFVGKFSKWATTNNVQSNINLFHTNVLFLYPLKTPENQKFSGGIEMKHWPKMGWK